MGILRTAVRGAVPVSRAGVAVWAWKHRNEIGGWAGYVARAAPKVAAGDTADVLAEGRLRARFSADKRTRNVDGLRVDVQDGVAILTGMVPTEAHDAAMAIATNTNGIRRVRDDLTEPVRRRRFAAG
jgi:osmotically-inducible protein OsmY